MFGTYLSLLSVYDIRYKRVPKKMLLLGVCFAAGYVCISLWKQNGDWMSLLLSWGFGCLPGIFLLIMALLTQKIGPGDGCVMLLIGVMAGIKSGIVILAGSLLLALFYSILVLVVRKKGRTYCFPYIPFLTLAYWLQII